MSALLKEPLLQVRPMQTADLADVMRVEETAYAHPWTPGIFNDSLRAGYLCQVCELNGELIGHAVMSLVLDEAHLLNLCIAPGYQGHGLGRKLLRRMLRMAQEHKADTVFLEVRIGNLTAQTLYQSEGFNEIGRRREYYPADNGREDALVYAKSLI